MTQQAPILSIKMVPAGVVLVLQGLNKLPREQVDGLFNEIAGQFAFQMEELQKAAQPAVPPAPPAEPLPNASHVDETTGLTD